MSRADVEAQPLRLQVGLDDQARWARRRRSLSRRSPLPARPSRSANFDGSQRQARRAFVTTVPHQQGSRRPIARS